MTPSNILNKKLRQKIYATTDVFYLNKFTSIYLFISTKFFFFFYYENFEEFKTD